MQLQLLPDERFTCRSCTDCCRRWYVQLFDGEPGKIDKLNWPTTDPLHGVKGLSKHAGKTYLAHRADGACVFLNEKNGLCRIHETFGAEAKPMACQLYPFQITPTFKGEASVSARYDCPTVRKNLGDPHAVSLPLIRGYVNQSPLPPGFDDALRSHLDRDQIGAVAEFVATLLDAFDRNDQRAMFILYLADVLAVTAPDHIDRPALAAIFGPIKAEIEATTSTPVSKPGLIHRFAFRTLLALHLRRDEDILDGRATRIGRLLSMIAFVAGFGSFRGLGLFHPPGSLRKAHLLSGDPQPSPETFALLWRLVRNKLESFQFMGSGNGNRNFIAGLRSLSLLYPLVLSAARHRAATRDSQAVDPSDVDYAVAAIEHSFGRATSVSPVITGPIEKVLLDRASFSQLVRTI